MSAAWRPIVLLLVLLAGAGSTQAIAGLPVTGYLNAAQQSAWQSDLRFMAAQMPKTHRNLYHSISPHTFTAMVNSLSARIPSLTRAEVIVGMAQIVAAVGDGHTNIYPTRDSKIGFHTLPVEFTFFGSELYIRAVHKTQSELLGARVLRIGNLDTNAAYMSVTSMIGHENDGGAHYWAQYLLAEPEVLEALHITAQLNDVPLTLETEHGTMHVTLHPFAPVEVMSGDISTLFYRHADWIDARDLTPGQDPAWLRQIDIPFHFEHIGNVLYVQINVVNNDPNETLSHFAQRLQDEIAATKPDKVAIDLRQNRGGDGTLIVPIIRSLVQSRAIDRPGHLFAIIGPATFSAAQMLTDVLERYTDVIFVGEPTGSRGNTYGDSRKLLLPNSGVTVRAAIYYWQDWYPWDNRTATDPKISAPLTFQEYRQKIDPAMEAIIRYSATP